MIPNDCEYRPLPMMPLSGQLVKDIAAATTTCLELLKTLWDVSSDTRRLEVEVARAPNWLGPLQG